LCKLKVYINQQLTSGKSLPLNSYVVKNVNADSTLPESKVSVQLLCNSQHTKSCCCTSRVLSLSNDLAAIWLHAVQRFSSFSSCHVLA
jgi:hypothetical protein